MIDHVSVAVRDLVRAGGFYDVVLGVLDFKRLQTRIRTVGYGKRYPELWLNHRPQMADVFADGGAHVCLRATSPQMVDEFFATAVGAGARSAGEPGLRPAYGPGYYAAFIDDVDGNRLEAVHFTHF